MVGAVSIFEINLLINNSQFIEVLQLHKVYMFPVVLCFNAFKTAREAMKTNLVIVSEFVKLSEKHC